MDTSKAKKTGKKQNEEKATIKVVEYGVSHVRCVEGKKGDIVFFTLLLNGVTINGCRVASGKNGDFISFPQTQGKDGNYYSVVYAPLSGEDSDAILEAVQEELNK